MKQSNNEAMMTPSAHIAKHLKDVYFGGNWTVSSLKEHLSDVTWQEAVTRVHGLNTIARLTYHIGYYVTILMRVLQGGPLEGSDKFSFDHPPIQSAEDWQNLLDKTWAEAETLAALIEQVPEDKLWGDFIDAKYGTYYRNVQGVVEHTHYHLGQIVVIKKMVRQ